MNHKINSQTDYWALSVLKTSLWVAGKNASLFFLLLAGLSVLTILFEKSLGDLTQSLDADSIVERFGNSVVLLKYVFELMLLKVALVHVTIRTLSGKPTSLRRIFKRIRGFRFTASAIKVVTISVMYLVVGFVLSVLLIAGVASGIQTGNVSGSVFWVLVCCLISCTLFAKYYVAIPVTVVERESILCSLSRSNTLTDDHKWSVFRLICLIFLLVLLVFIAIALLPAVATEAFGWDVPLERHKAMWSQGWPFLRAFLVALFAVLDGIATTVAYVYMKSVQEGTFNGLTERGTTHSEIHGPEA